MSIFSERMDGARFHKTTYYGTKYFMGGGGFAGTGGAGYKWGLDFRGKMRRLRQEMNQMTLRMGKMAKEHTMNNFKAEAFVDKEVQRWPAKKVPNGKKILIDTGRMKMGIFVGSKTRNGVRLTAPAPYSGIHNRPVHGKPKEYNGKLYPGRKFMGPSKVLSEATKKMIVTRLNLAAQV